MKFEKPQILPPSQAEVISQELLAHRTKFSALSRGQECTMVDATEIGEKSFFVGIFFFAYDSCYLILGAAKINCRCCRQYYLDVEVYLLCTSTQSRESGAVR